VKIRDFIGRRFLLSLCFHNNILPKIRRGNTGRSTEVNLIQTACRAVQVCLSDTHLQRYRTLYPLRLLFVRCRSLPTCPVEPMWKANLSCSLLTSTVRQGLIRFPQNLTTRARSSTIVSTCTFNAHISVGESTGLLA